MNKLSEFIHGANLYQKEFNSLGIETLNDLIYYLPKNYVYPSKFVDFNNLIEGENVTIVGRIINVNGRQMKSRKGYLINVFITDDKNIMEIPFFAFRPQIFKYMINLFKKDSLGLWTGTVTEHNNKLSLTHPDFQIIGGFNDAVNINDSYEQFYNDFSKPIPIYKGTKKLSSFKIHKTIMNAFSKLTADDFTEVIPKTIPNIKLSFFEALKLIHNPSNINDIKISKYRIKYEEAFLTQRIPFDLTNTQNEAIQKISTLLTKTTPMNALLHGDVGAGKTIVALKSMLQVVDNGAQAVLLAPTEVLAQQHFETISTFLEPMEKSVLNTSGIKITLLTGSSKNKKQITLDIASGNSNIIIGTHALFNDKLIFNKLGFVVIDEQHRFGVEQRAKLLSRKNPPHLLMMTATPIPRTLAITIFGDMEILSLTKLPKGRKPVITRYVIYESKKYMNRVFSRISEEVKKGYQIFIIVPRIENSNNAAKLKHDLITVYDAYKMFSSNLPNLRFAKLHGKMNSQEKQQVMNDFLEKKYDILISTTVIEVGIDIPNASMMVILDADRFGISTLHQLRGRIKRGSHESICILITHNGIDHFTENRIKALVNTEDGFLLSEIDLENRQEGDVLGESQSGFYKTFRLLKVVKDKELIEKAHNDVEKYYSQIDKNALDLQIKNMFEGKSEYLNKS